MTSKKATFMEISSIIFFILSAYISIKFNISNMLRLDIYYLVPLSYVILSFSFDRGLLSRRLFIWLGNISIPFYLFHQIVLVFVARKFSSYIISLRHAFVFGGIALFVTVVLSGLYCYYLEEYLSEKCRKILHIWFS